MASPGDRVPAEPVDAAVRAAGSEGRDVADVPLVAIARAAGESHSTSLRRERFPDLDRVCEVFAEAFLRAVRPTENNDEERR